MANERTGDARRRYSDRRRRAGGLVGGAAACAAAEGAGKTLSVAVLEKAAEPGAHLLSGAVLDPRALAELVPDFESKGAPLASKVREDRIYFLTPSGKIKFPITPPPLQNHGNYIISLQQLGKWLSGLVEAEGIDMFSGFAGIGAVDGGRPCRRSADRRSWHRAPRREARRRSSRAWTFARR